MRQILLALEAERAKLSVEFDGDRGQPMKKELKPVHAGEILQKGFPEPMGISQNKLAKSVIG